MRPSRCSAPCVIVAAILSLVFGQAHAGGVPLPQKVPPDWVSVQTLADGDVVRTIARIPHDPNTLGVRPAHLRTKPYHFAFRPTKFAAADGTPLAGMLAMWDDDRPRPGVVVVPGLTQTMDLKFMVEVAEFLARNGWHVLAIDLRGHGESRKLSSAMITFGWKETDDILGAVRHLQQRTAPTSVSVIGFSLGGRSLVKAMAQDGGALIAAGIAVTAPLAGAPPLVPPAPGAPQTPLAKFTLDFLGAPSFYDYFDRAARSYGVDVHTFQANNVVETSIAQVKKPLLMLYALDDFQALLQVKIGRHDGGTFSLRYRDAVRDHPHVRTLLVDRGNHAGMLYLSDPHWFALTTLTYLKHWQAREVAYVTAAAPALDVLVDGQVAGQTVTYRIVVRNNGARTAGPLDVHVQLPSNAGLEHCWVGFEGLGRCANDGHRLRWTIPRLSGGKSSTAPLVAVIDVSRIQKGPFETRVWVTSVDGMPTFDEDHAAALPQQLILTKP